MQEGGVGNSCDCNNGDACRERAYPALLPLAAALLLASAAA